MTNHLPERGEARERVKKVIDKFGKDLPPHMKQLAEKAIVEMETDHLVPRSVRVHS